MKQTLRLRFPFAVLLLAALLLASLLAACGGDDGSGSAEPPRAITPVTDADGDTPSPYEVAALRVDDPRSVAWSPDGDTLAFSDGPRIWLYTADLEPIRSLEGHSAAVRDLAWSPDGTRLASAGLDATARVWDPATGDTLVTLSGHDDWVFTVAWSPDGAQLVTGSADNTVRLWDAATGESHVALGSTRLQGVIFRLVDEDLLDAIATLNDAEAVRDAVEGEAFAGLVGQLKDADWGVIVTFDDPALAEALLALSTTDYTLAITTGDADLDARLAALSQSEREALLLMLGDEDVAADLDAIDAAEATIADIEARDDADLIHTVRNLQTDELVLVITTEEGETTTASVATGDFITALAGLEGEDFTVAFGVENGDAIAASLQDPEFIDALRQYDEALRTLGEFNAREDATLLRLARLLRNQPYTLTVTTGDAAVDETLAALDETVRAELIALRQDETLTTTVQALAQADYDAAAVGGVTVRDVYTALGPLPHTLAFEVEDEALAAELEDLSNADVLRLSSLLANGTFLDQVTRYEEAVATLAELSAREDFPLIAALRGARLNAYGREVNQRLIIDAFDQNGYYVMLLPDDETTIRALSINDDAGILEALRTGDLTAALEAGHYTMYPQVTPDQIAPLVATLFGESFQASVQREQNGHTESVIAVAWSPDGALIASAGADFTIRLWEVEGDRLLAVLDDHEDGLTDLAWSPDGTLLASASWDNTVRLWDMSAPDAVKSVATVSGLDSRIIALAWSPDSTRLAGVGRDGAVRLWDSTGEDLASPGSHAAEGRALAWSPDGTRLVTGGLDRTLRVWDMVAASGDTP